MKRLLIGAVLFAAAGLLVTLGFTVANGVDYRIQEDQGLSGWSPQWIITGTYVGLAILAIGALAFLVLGAMTLAARRRRVSARI